MTVSVNPVSRPQSDMDQLAQAVGLALKFYDIKMSKEQQEAVNNLNKQKAEAAAMDEAVKFQGANEPVMERPKAGPFIPIEQAPSFAREKAPEGSIGYVPVSFGQKQRELDISQANLDYQRGEKNKERIAGLRKDFDNKPEVKGAVDRIATANLIDSLLDEANPTSLSIAQMQVARIAQGVGVLSDKDVTRVGGSQDVVSQAKRLANKLANGEPLIAQDIKDLKQVTAIYKKAAQQDLETQADRFSKQNSAYVSMTQNDIKNNLALDSYYNGVLPIAAGKKPAGATSNWGTAQASEPKIDPKLNDQDFLNQFIQMD